MDLCYDIYLTEAQMKKTEKQLDKTYDIIEKVSTQIAVKGKNKSKALLEEARELGSEATERHMSGKYQDACPLFEGSSDKYEQSRTALEKELAGYKLELMAADSMAQEIDGAIKRNRLDSRSAIADVIYDTKEICTFCNEEWDELKNGQPACCNQAVQEWEKEKL